MEDFEQPPRLRSGLFLIFTRGARDGPRQKTPTGLCFWRASTRRAVWQLTSGDPSDNSRQRSLAFLPTTASHQWWRAPFLTPANFERLL